MSAEHVAEIANGIRQVVSEVDRQQNSTTHGLAILDDNHNSPPLDDVDPVEISDDPVFRQIQATILNRRMSEMSQNSSATTEEQGVLRTSHNLQSIPYGFQPRATYEHHKKNPNIMGVCYNGRFREFVMLDSKGITTWCKDSVKVKDTGDGRFVPLKYELPPKARRAMLYPKYEYRLITNIVYARKHNVYFALGKDFTLKVLNDKFEQTCSVSAGMRSVLFMLFNPIADELITGGVDGTKVWVFEQAAESTFKEIRAMANYKLRLKYELNNVGGSWVKKVELDQVMQHLYCCSDTDLYAYDLHGNLLFSFKNAHSMSISGCVYSQEANFLVTSSHDSEIKVWSLVGGYIHTFRGHSRAITHMMLHPDCGSLVLTSSLDGTVRMWSLHTFQEVYSIVMSADGILWMGLTDDRLMYVSTVRSITIWNLNYQYSFWSMSRSGLNMMKLCSGTIEDKTTRVLTLGLDSSIRLFSRKTAQNLSTVLPPPPISPLQQVKAVAYNRELSIIYVLIDSRTLWLYTARTDPACRLAVWDTQDLQEMARLQFEVKQTDISQDMKSTKRIMKIGRIRKSFLARDSKKQVSTHLNHRATEMAAVGEELSVDVLSICCLSSPACVWTEEGECCPVNDRYLLLGLKDGRILFLDPYIKGKKYMEFKANKDSIVHIEQNRAYNCLITTCHGQQYDVIQTWDLPSLKLLHEVACDEPVVDFARLSNSMMLGFECGAIELDDLDLVEDPGPLKPTLTRMSEDAMYRRKTNRNREHKAAIIAIDALASKEVYASASADGYIKIWNAVERTLTTEILLNDSLCSLLFLNSRGDLIFGFHNQIYILEAARVLHNISIRDEDEEDDGEESDIYEDPYVKYENISVDPEPLNLDKYLKPYDLVFDHSFMAGNVVTEPEEEVVSEEISESEISMAPTETYFSPMETPLTLSLLDLRMSATVTNQDIRTFRRLSQSSLTKDIIREMKQKRDIITYPAFGVSPGPSPTVTPPTTPPTPSEASVSEGGESSAEEPEPAPVVEVKKSALPVKKKAVQEIVREPTKFETRPTNISKVKLDVKKIMADEKKKVAISRSTIPKADHDHLRKPEAKMSGGGVDKKVVKKMRKTAPKRARAVGVKNVTGVDDEEEDDDDDDNEAKDSGRKTLEQKLTRSDTAIKSKKKIVKSISAVVKSPSDTGSGVQPPPLPVTTDTTQPSKSFKGKIKGSNRNILISDVPARSELPSQTLQIEAGPPTLSQIKIKPVDRKTLQYRMELPSASFLDVRAQAHQQALAVVGTQSYKSSLLRMQLPKKSISASPYPGYNSSCLKGDETSSKMEVVLAGQSEDGLVKVQPIKKPQASHDSHLRKSLLIDEITQLIGLQQRFLAYHLKDIRQMVENQVSLEHIFCQRLNLSKSHLLDIIDKAISHQVQITCLTQCTDEELVFRVVQDVADQTAVCSHIKRTTKEDIINYFVNDVRKSTQEAGLGVTDDFWQKVTLVIASEIVGPIVPGALDQVMFSKIFDDFNHLLVDEDLSGFAATKIRRIFKEMLAHGLLDSDSSVPDRSLEVDTSINKQVKCVSVRVSFPQSLDDGSAKPDRSPAMTFADLGLQFQQGKSKHSFWPRIKSHSAFDEESRRKSIGLSSPASFTAANNKLRWRREETGQRSSPTDKQLVDDSSHFQSTAFSLGRQNHTAVEDQRPSSVGDHFQCPDVMEGLSFHSCLNDSQPNLPTCLSDSVTQQTPDHIVLGRSVSQQLVKSVKKLDQQYSLPSSDRLATNTVSMKSGLHGGTGVTDSAENFQLEMKGIMEIAFPKIHRRPVRIAGISLSKILHVLPSLDFMKQREEKLAQPLTPSTPSPDIAPPSFKSITAVLPDETEVRHTPTPRPRSAAARYIDSFERMSQDKEGEADDSDMGQEQGEEYRSLIEKGLDAMYQVGIHGPIKIQRRPKTPGLLDEVSSIISHSSARKHRHPTIPEQYDESAADVLKQKGRTHVSRAWFTSDESDDSDAETVTFRSLFSASTTRRPDPSFVGPDDLPPRPYTVQAGPDKELEEAFQTALENYKRYQQSKGNDNHDIMKNEGVNFDGNWQERMIERHLLIKMQKQMRVQSAAHRRHLLSLRKQQRIKEHERQHERADNMVYFIPHSCFIFALIRAELRSHDSYLQLLRKIRVQERAYCYLKSKCEEGFDETPFIQPRYIKARGLPLAALKSPVAPKVKVPDPILPPGVIEEMKAYGLLSLSSPTHDIKHKWWSPLCDTSRSTNWSGGDQPRSRDIKKRPYTAPPGGCRRTVSSHLYYPGDTSFHVLNQIARANQNTRLDSRPSTSLRPRTAGASFTQELTPEVVDKMQKGAEKPYRLRLSTVPDDYEEVLLKQKRVQRFRIRDPRDPTISRPHSSKSIPSKCTRYVLISPPKQPTGMSLTPLEEQLLAQRFPSQHMKIFRQERDRKMREYMVVH